MRMLSPAEVAVMCKVPAPSVTAMCKRGVIGCKYGQRWLIHRDDARAMMVQAHQIRMGQFRLNPDRVELVRQCLKAGMSRNKIAAATKSSPEMIRRYIAWIAVADMDKPDGLTPQQSKDYDKAIKIRNRQIESLRQRYREYMVNGYLADGEIPSEHDPQIEQDLALIPDPPPEPEDSQLDTDHQES